MTENLWLNLSTGHIGSGRKNWDGTGGTGAALNHFEATGRQYPLCVKLGTITPQVYREPARKLPNLLSSITDEATHGHYRGLPT